VVRLAVRLTPRGGRDRIDGWGRDDAGRTYLKARVSAPPVDGAANGALEALVAKTLGVARGSVRVVSGETARIKQLEIEGAEAADLARAFGAPD
jgi:uncharacterized protein YggU (UPF0235/DUF167 family)